MIEARGNKSGESLMGDSDWSPSPIDEKPCDAMTQ